MPKIFEVDLAEFNGSGTSMSSAQQQADGAFNSWKSDPANANKNFEGVTRSLWHQDQGGTEVFYCSIWILYSSTIVPTP